jgi:alkanesulfonate monooxygenase SsuD/methylene tetrahydromethanopterin reductase-like flavin-dependent oxidoreductase (luciferase family)
MRIVKVTGTPEQIERLGTMRDKILAKQAAREAGERAKREASEAAERARRIAPTFFCFVCCGNSSVASALYTELTSRVPALLSALGMRLDSVGHYIADGQAIRGMRSDIAARDLPYKGFQLMGNREESIEKLDDWLIWIRDEVHIVYACAQVDMYPRLQRVYNEIYSQALTQNILPFPMLVTQSAETKQFLLKACKAVS